jgi:putative transposase
MVKRCFELKVRANKLSTAKWTILEGAFREAKWIKNYQLNLLDPFIISTVADMVLVHAFNPATQRCDILEERPLQYLGSQMKQSVIKGVQQDIINLGKARKAGRRVGRLRFTREVRCIPLKQHGVTYTVTPKGVKVQKIGFLKVSGLDQLYEDGLPIGEFAEGKLLHRASGYYIQVLAYLDPARFAKPSKDRIGLDFGVGDPVVLSDGRKPDLCVPYPKALRRAHRAVSRCQPHSLNRWRARQVLQRQHERYTRQKRDKANQLLHLLKQYSQVGVQDDHIAAWRRHWGGKMQEADIGSIKRRVKCLRTSTCIPSYISTTQECPRCHQRNLIPLSERTYACSCGFREDRDVKAAKAILCYSLYQQEHPSTELRGLSAEERATVYSKYEFASPSRDAGDAADFSPR